MPKAASNYKQVQLTITEERCWNKPHLVNLRLRVMVKPANAQWTEKHTFLIDQRLQQPPLATTDDVFAAVLEFLAAPPLPGHIG